MGYSPSCQDVSRAVDSLMKTYTHNKKDIGYGYRRIFENKQWFDIIDYKKTGKVFLRLGRGAWLVREYPVLYNRFDEVLKVVAKIEITDPQTLQDKHFAGILELLEQAPYNVGCFD